MKSITQSTSAGKMASALLTAARLAFAAAIVLIPWRLSLWTLPRPEPHLYSVYTDIAVSASEAAVVLCLALWLPALLLERRRPSLGPRYLWIPLALLIAVGEATVTVSADPTASAYQALRLLVLFWFCVFLINEIRSAAWLVIPITIQVGIQSMVALCQFLAQRSIGLVILGELHLDPSVPGIAVVTAGGIRLLRAYGLASHPNVLGGSLAFGLVVLFGACLRGFNRPLALTAFALGIPALLATFSRSAWLAFGVGMALLAIAEIEAHPQDAPKKLAAFALASLVPAAAMLFSYSAFFGIRLGSNNSFSAPTMEQQSIGERLILIDASLPLVHDHPFLGVGLAASPMALEREAPGLTVPYQPPHLALLDATLETGLTGAAIYLLLLLMPLILAVRNVRLISSNQAGLISLALLLALAVVGLFDYYTWLFPSGLLWQWLAWGMWGASMLGLGSTQIASQPAIMTHAGVAA